MVWHFSIDPDINNYIKIFQNITSMYRCSPIQGKSLKFLMKCYEGWISEWNISMWETRGKQIIRKEDKIYFLHNLNCYYVFIREKNNQLGDYVLFLVVHNKLEIIVSFTDSHSSGNWSPFLVFPFLCVFFIHLPYCCPPFIYLWEKQQNKNILSNIVIINNFM